MDDVTVTRELAKTLSTVPPNAVVRAGVVLGSVGSLLIIQLDGANEAVNVERIKGLEPMLGDVVWVLVCDSLALAFGIKYSTKLGIDIRTRWTRTTGVAYPGNNAPIVWENGIYAFDPPTLNAAGTIFTMTRAGLYQIMHQVNWGASAAAAVCASWIQEGVPNRRHASDQVVPTNGVAGWTTGGSSTMRLVPGDTIQVQVFTPSGTPAGIQAAEIEITWIGP